MVNQELLNQFKNILRQDKLKFTPQRVMVLEEVIQGDSHRECEDIYLTLKRRNKNVSRATVRIARCPTFANTPSRNSANAMDSTRTMP